MKIITTIIVILSTIVMAQKNQIFLEWKRFSKLKDGGVYGVKVENTIKEDRNGYYKIYVDLNGKLTYKITESKEKSCFEVSDTSKVNMKVFTYAIFLKSYKITYIKYKILEKKKDKMVFSGKILNKKEIKPLPDKRISDWTSICQYEKRQIRKIQNK